MPPEAKPLRAVCPKCQSAFRVSIEHAGQQAKCGNCDQQFRVPEVPLASPPPPRSSPAVEVMISDTLSADTSPAASIEELHEDLADQVRVPTKRPVPRPPEAKAEEDIAPRSRWVILKSAKIMTVVTVTVFLVAGVAIVGDLLPADILLLLFAIGMAVYTAGLRFPSRRRLSRWCTAVVGILVFTAFFRFDTYTNYWTSENGMSYADTKQRYTGKIVYRRIWKFTPSYTSADGPIIQTGVDLKVHGHWSFLDRDFQREDRWYWYGEEITEGEWHLRN